jgi:hypothetical protein
MNAHVHPIFKGLLDGLTTTKSSPRPGDIVEIKPMIGKVLKVDMSAGGEPVAEIMVESQGINGETIVEFARVKFSRLVL